MMNKNATARLTGTAILAALVIVFDYTLKYSGLKIPFPLYPNLKFDFTGIPIVMSLFMYGLTSATTTSVVAALGIIARSGNVVSATMKMFAELATVVGIWVGVRVSNSGDSENNTYAMALGVASRIIIMSIVNLYVLPNVYHVPASATLNLLPVIGFFNFLQGGITIGLGLFLVRAVSKRLPRWSDE